MNAQAFDPTANPPRSASEVLRVDTRFLNGQPFVAHAGAVFPFPTAKMQATHRLIGMQWLKFQLVKDPLFPTLLQGAGYTVTLRDFDGNFICQDLPLSRLGSWPVTATQSNSRTLWFSATFIDWRRSFVRAIVPVADRVIAIEAIYQ